MKNRRAYLLPIFLSILFILFLASQSMCAETTDATGGKAATPKNIIVMISDGCGFNHVEAASLYQHGEPDAQVYHKFPLTIAMSTYEAGQGYDPAMAWKYFKYVMLEATDSAASATAMACGEKTYGGAIGVGIDGQKLKNVVERAEELGKATGVITSVEFSHATPAGFVAHKGNRGDYSGIANEMIKESAVEVIMGCGNPYFDKDGKALLDTAKPNYGYVGGPDTWKELVAGTAGGDADGDGKADPWKLIQKREEFQKLGEGEAPSRVIGVPQMPETLQQRRGGDAGAEPYKVPLVETVPTLVEMTNAALNVLDNDPDGFFLMIEGGAVDWASHSNQGGRMIEEEIDFSNAVKAVAEWVEKNSSWEDTLVIVTADHETGYITGPDSGVKDGKAVWNPVVNNGKGKMPGLQWHSGGHTDSLVPFYANGPENAMKVIRSRVKGTDGKRGTYVDNTDIANSIFELWK